MRERWLTTAEFTELTGTARQVANRVLKRCHSGKMWKGFALNVREVPGRGGRSGIRYEVALSSLPEALQEALREPEEVALPAPPVPKFIAAPNQTAEERRRMLVLEPIAATEPGSAERAALIRDQARRHKVELRTVQRWVRQCETHDWDLDALGRKRPSDAGRRRVFISRPFDKAFLAAGGSAEQLIDLADWLDREIAGWWQSPVSRAGWKRVKRETITSLQRECREVGVILPFNAFTVSKRRIEAFRFHSAVDRMLNDIKRHDDAKPRIRRDNSQFFPMEQIVMDVKPTDCVLLRPDGSPAYPKLIGFMDTATQRITGRIILLSQGEGIRQEHVTDAFLDMVDDPNWGFPSQLYYDNGTEYQHFDVIRECLKLVAAEGARTNIKARPYSGASKPIESKFAVLDRHIFSQMAGYTGPNRMDKRHQRLGKEAKPYPGTIEDFEREFFVRLKDFESWPIGSGPFKDKSPTQVYHGHVDAGWRPVHVDRLALDCAFAKRLGDRRIDRGAISIDGQRFRHPELAAYSGRRVPVAKPYRRASLPLAKLPEIGWVGLEPEMLHLPGDISGAIEAGRMQRQYNRTVQRIRRTANGVDPMRNLNERVATLPTRAAPAPLMDVMLSTEAENFAGARIEAEAKRQAQPSEEERRNAEMLEQAKLTERYLAKLRNAG